LDRETRGTIEEALDSVLEQDILEIVGWILEEFAIESPQDLALGYLLGSLMRYGHSVVRMEKLTKRQKKRLEKELGKERARDLQKGWEEKAEEVKPIKVTLTEKEANQIRNMLRKSIPDYQRKIFRELHR